MVPHESACLHSSPSSYVSAHESSMCPSSRSSIFGASYTAGFCRCMHRKTPPNTRIDPGVCRPPPPSSSSTRSSSTSAHETPPALPSCCPTWLSWYARLSLIMWQSSQLAFRPSACSLLALSLAPFCLSPCGCNAPVGEFVRQDKGLQQMRCLGACAGWKYQSNHLQAPDLTSVVLICLHGTEDMALLHQRTMHGNSKHASSFHIQMQGALQFQCPKLPSTSCAQQIHFECNVQPSVNHTPLLRQQEHCDSWSFTRR